MIQGFVGSRREAMLSLVIGNTNKKRQVIDAVKLIVIYFFQTDLLTARVSSLILCNLNADQLIDTGFNGFLTLTATIIATLELPWNASDIVTLGDGSETLFDLCAATVIWDGQYREVDIAESETEPLVGMALLYGYRLQIDAVEGGIVRIEAL